MNALATEDQIVLTLTSLARHRMRALMAACSIGLLVGASVGATWLGWQVARETDLRNPADQVQTAQITPSAHQQDNPNDAQTPDASTLRIADHYTLGDGKPLPLRMTMMDQAGMDQAGGKIVADHPMAPRAAASFKFAGHNQNDTDCLTQAVYYEARGEGTDGMRAVAQVIVNRVRNPNYPKSICAVVYQGASQHGCQFSFACDGSADTPARNAAWRRARSIAEAAMNGYVMKSVGSATSFHTVSVHPDWAGTMQRVATIGSHIFYQLRGRNVQLASANVVRPSTMPAAPVVATADDSAHTALLNALSRAQNTVKPVTASAQVDGKAAAEIVTAVSGETLARSHAKEAAKPSGASS